MLPFLYCEEKDQCMKGNDYTRLKKSYCIKLFAVNALMPNLKKAESGINFA
jgi:hypothetical protein